MRRSARRFRRHGTGSRGVTLLELVVALGLAAVLAGAVLAGVQPGGAGHAARAARAFLLWARLEAMWSGRPVAVLQASWPGLVARAGDGAGLAAACTGPVVRRLRVDRFPRVRVRLPLRAGIVWLPTGGARSCAGGGVVSGRIELADRAHTVAVVVSSLGRVRLEAVP